MPGLHSYTSRELIAILEQHGFTLARSKGSHRIYKNVATHKMAVVPMHTKDLPKGTFHAILKQAGIDKAELQ